MTAARIAREEPCVSPIAHRSEQCPPPGFKNWAKCEHCNGDGTRMVVTDESLDGWIRRDRVLELIDAKTPSVQQCQSAPHPTGRSLTTVRWAMQELHDAIEKEPT